MPKTTSRSRPWHPSLSPHAAAPNLWPGRDRPPRVRDMDRMDLTREQIEVIEQICIDIFVDMTNAKRSVVECMTAAFLTGVHLTLEIRKEGKLDAERQPEAG